MALLDGYGFCASVPHYPFSPAALASETIAAHVRYSALSLHAVVKKQPAECTALQIKISSILLG